MNFIWIRKYKEPDGSIKNYFDSPTKVDEFKTEEFFEEGFPEFDESVNTKDDIFKPEASTFTFKFSLLDTKKSTSGYNIKEFIKPQYDFNAKYFVWIKYENKDVIGIIDVNSILIDYTKTQNKYELQFDSYSLEKEFENWCGKPIYIPVAIGQEYPPDRLFENFIYGYLFHSKLTGGQCFYFNLDAENIRQTWFNKLGFYPKVMGRVWNSILDYLKYMTQIEFDIGWWYFLDFAQSLGFSWRFEINEAQPYTNYFSVKLRLFFRNIANNGQKYFGDISNNLIEHREKVYLNAKKFVVIPAIRVVRPMAINYPYPYMLGGGVATAGYKSFVNDLETKSAIISNPNRMIIDGADGSVYDEKITWQGERLPEFNQPIKIEDAQILVDNAHLFALDTQLVSPQNTWNATYYFRGHIQDFQTHEDLELSISMGRLCVKDVLYEIQGEFYKTIFITDTGWMEILKFALQQYPYSYIGDKTVKELVVEFNFNNIPSVFDTFTLEGYNYWIHRITKLNLIDRTLTLEAIEI